MTKEENNFGCKTHPDAPHGFVRNASHSEDRYVCECEFWEPPEQDEPVGKFAKFNDGIWREVTVGSSGVPLYTHPKEWVGLTDEEIDECDWGQSERDHARAIEAKLKEKNA